MTDRIAMESDDAYVEMLPSLGGAVTAFDLKQDGGRVAVFRRWNGEPDDPRTVSCSPMVPFFNRISGGGFAFDGTFYPIAPNVAHEPVPIHGDGWYTPWQVKEKSLSRVALTLRSTAIPPFDYEATQVAELKGGTLSLQLSVEHCGDKPIPYGIGFHPWFDRTPGVVIHAPVTGVWLEQPPDFPAKPTPEKLPEKWDYNTPHGLPDDFFDNGFAGWSGKGRIEWKDRGVVLDVEADPPTPYLHMYSLDKDCPVFCFEPVTQPFNAYGLPGTPESRGLAVLAKGEKLSLKVHFAAHSR